MSVCLISVLIFSLWIYQWLVAFLCLTIKPHLIHWWWFIYFWLMDQEVYLVEMRCFMSFSLVLVHSHPGPPSGGIWTCQRLLLQVCEQASERLCIEKGNGRSKPGHWQWHKDMKMKPIETTCHMSGGIMMTHHHICVCNMQYSEGICYNSVSDLNLKGMTIWWYDLIWYDICQCQIFNLRWYVVSDMQMFQPFSCDDSKCMSSNDRACAECLCSFDTIVSDSLTVFIWYDCLFHSG